MNRTHRHIDLTSTDADPALGMAAPPEGIVVQELIGQAIGDAPLAGDPLGGVTLTAQEIANPDIVKRSIVVAGHKTSVSLEDAFWHALKDIARERGQSLRSLVAEIDSGRKGGNLSSAVRLHVLDHYRRRAGAVSAIKA